MLRPSHSAFYPIRYADRFYSDDRLPRCSRRMVLAHAHSLEASTRYMPMRPLRGGALIGRFAQS